MKDSFISRTWDGFRSFFNALIFINDNGLWKYTIIPAILSLFIAIALIALITIQLMSLTDQWLMGFEGGLWSVVRVFASFLAFFISIFITLFSFRILVSILIMPFMGPLLEKVEFIVAGKSFQTSFSQDFKNIFLGLYISLRFLIVEIFCLILFSFTGPLQPILMVLVESYLLGRSTYDYILEKHSRTVRERKVLAQDFTAEMLGTGLGYHLFLLIPVVGILLAPVAAITSAALVYYRKNI